VSFNLWFDGFLGEIVRRATARPCLRTQTPYHTVEWVRFASQQNRSGYVRFGSQADMAGRVCNVRFTPRSGHCRTTLGCPLCAKNGHQARGEL